MSTFGRMCMCSMLENPERENIKKFLHEFASKKFHTVLRRITATGTAGIIYITASRLTLRVQI